LGPFGFFPPCSNFGTFFGLFLRLFPLFSFFQVVVAIGFGFYSPPFVFYGLGFWLVNLLWYLHVKYFFPFLHKFPLFDHHSYFFHRTSLSFFSCALVAR